MRHQSWILLLLIPTFAKGCVLPGWSSALEFALCSGLVAFLYYYRPTNPLEEKHFEEMKEVQAKVQNVQEQVNFLRVKIGIR